MDVSTIKATGKPKVITTHTLGRRYVMPIPFRVSPVFPFFAWLVLETLVSLKIFHTVSPAS